MSKQTDERTVREFCEEEEIAGFDPALLSDFHRAILAALIRKVSATRFDPHEE